jgi:3D (Asp-Asp-Asp) domain-containing protein
VITQPVNEIIAIGTGSAEAEATSGGLIIGDGFIITEDGEVLTYTHTQQARATAYTHTDAGCDFWTATNTHVRIGTVAVDPRYIPYGTRMFIVSNDGAYIYGIATAEDCGGAIKQDRIDLYFPTTAECFQFGRRDCTIYFLG